MKIGDTFMRKDSDRHLWIVLSDPAKNADRVLLVNMTSWNERKERACMLDGGDHPWITHETCINYGDAVVNTLPNLLSAKDGGAIVMKETLSASVLQRILDGAAESTRLSLENAEILEDQELIDL